MPIRIAVASQMFHGLLVVYRDSVVENPALFAQQALSLADSLLAGDADRASKGSGGSPTQASSLRSQDDIDLARLIVAKNDGLLCEIERLRDGKTTAGEGRTIH